VTVGPTVRPTRGLHAVGVERRHQVHRQRRVASGRGAVAVELAHGRGDSCLVPACPAGREPPPVAVRIRRPTASQRDAGGHQDGRRGPAPPRITGAPAVPSPAWSGREARADETTHPSARHCAAHGRRAEMVFPWPARPGRRSRSGRPPPPDRCAAGSGRSRSISRINPAPAHDRDDDTGPADHRGQAGVDVMADRAERWPHRASASRTPSVIRPMAHRSGAWRRRMEGGLPWVRGYFFVARWAGLRAGGRGAAGRRFVVTTVQ
jgi:hypothetical protein